MKLRNECFGFYFCFFFMQIKTLTECPTELPNDERSATQPELNSSNAACQQKCISFPAQHY